MSLIIKNLTVVADGKEVVKNFSLTIKKGEIHALMGPNGSGKTSLCSAILGHPSYRITKGDILFKGASILGLRTEERAQLGIFLSFQEPPEIRGVPMSSFLRTVAKTHTKEKAPDTMKQVTMHSEKIGLGPHFLDRSLNEGFSGGEKKKSEILQFIAAHPRIALLDEIDAGVDIDSLDAIARILKKAASQGTGILIISHSARIFKRCAPDFVHIIEHGVRIASGGRSLLKKIEAKGYRKKS
ncbi:MAG: Fe-S cluster assembly ATPase SufC [Candidatus Azambacteria bacterium]|nr:Fe-S cluster assembly ATPase SufC [Candidatus Azambacteria bacterium]